MRSKESTPHYSDQSGFAKPSRRSISLRRDFAFRLTDRRCLIFVDVTVITTVVGDNDRQNEIDNNGREERKETPLREDGSA